MRWLVITVFSILFCTSCTDRERIAQYEKQLKESNEALEKIIDFRISSFNAAAAENPEKAGPWAEKAHAYFEKCYESLRKWPLTESEIADFTTSLEKLQSSQLDNSSYKLKKLEFDKPSLEAFKNQVLIHLNGYSAELISNIGASSWNIPYVVPIKMKIGDSTLVILEGNHLYQLPEFVISFDKPNPIKFNHSHSLGFFFLPKEYEDSVITGQVESFESHYSPDVKYYSFKVDTGFSNIGANDHFYTPKSAHRN